MDTILLHITAGNILLKAEYMGTSHMPYDRRKRELGKNAKDTQRQRTRKASISGKQNMAETDGAQEAEETDGPGKCGNSSEHSHGPNCDHLQKVITVDI